MKEHIYEVVYMIDHFGHTYDRVEQRQYISVSGPLSQETQEKLIRAYFVDGPFNLEITKVTHVGELANRIFCETRYDKL